MAKSKRLPPLKQWQETLKKITGYNTKQVRQYSKFSQLSKQLQHDIRSYAVRSSKAYQQRAHLSRSAFLKQQRTAIQQAKQRFGASQYKPDEANIVNVRRFDGTAMRLFRIDKATGTILKQFVPTIGKDKKLKVYEVDEQDNIIEDKEYQSLEDASGGYPIETDGLEWSEPDKEALDQKVVDQFEPEDDDEKGELEAYLDERYDDILSKLHEYPDLKELVDEFVSDALKDIGGKWSALPSDRMEDVFSLLDELTSFEEADDSYLSKYIQGTIEETYYVITGNRVSPTDSAYISRKVEDFTDQYHRDYDEIADENAPKKDFTSTRLFALWMEERQ